MAYQIMAIFLGAARANFGRIAGAAGIRSVLNIDELISDAAGGRIELTNLQSLLTNLKKVSPELRREFMKQSRRLGNERRRDLQSGLRKIGPNGPFSGKLRPTRNYDGFVSGIGRLSWGRTGGNKRPWDEVKFDIKRRTRARDKRMLASGQVETLGVLRLRVTSAATIMADLAGASGNYMYNRGKFRSREHDIRLFGRYLMTNHTYKIDKENVDKFVKNLSKGRAVKRSKPSRWAYPIVEKGMPKFREQFEPVLRSTVTKLNALMR